MGILRRYWIEFDLPSRQPRVQGIVTIDDTPEAYVRGGCGVTGYDLKDCLGLVRDVVFKGDDLPSVKSVTEDVDVSSLEGRLLSRPGVPVWRGVWYPDFQGSTPTE